MTRKILQTKVIVGRGTAQFFLEKDIAFLPPIPPVFYVKEIKKWVDVYNMKVIPGKVIFNAWVWKDINYKTAQYVCEGGNQVNGPLYHSTTKMPLAGFVDITPVPGEEILPTDEAEVLEAFVEGEKDHWSDEVDVGKGVIAYKKVHEKMVIKITFKVVRIEHVPVEVGC
ncbi:hypothetical protein [Clostridium sp. ZS2-4]|uniref:hypothetical protein n=1 Tax=Clostridium sp. ZS2-4 TaxID=2987703 RepID=UPI00227B7F69|nr:hypothetical protein [Clostridium sp. ZS2-4]MCY6355620.1 hypothetical protein [Clostridium sp. ZS2-4]